MAIFRRQLALGSGRGSSLWQELVPFESYGVLFREEELPSLVARLRALDGLTRARLRERALQVCRAHFRRDENGLGRSKWLTQQCSAPG